MERLSFSINKYRILLLFAGFFICMGLAAQNASEKSFSIHLKQGTLKEFSQIIEKQTGMSLAYGEDIRLKKLITLNINQKSLDTVLHQVFDEQGLDYRIQGSHILLFKKQEPKKTMTRRTHTISGYITDKKSGETLLGADIIFGRTGTTTNEFGFYSLTLPEGTVELTYSYMGFEAQKKNFTLSRDTLLSVALAESSDELAEVVITNKKEAGVHSTMPGSHVLTNEKLAQTPTLLGESDMVKTLQLLPGVQASNEGFSGMNVRGGSADQNLVMLDGIPVYNADHLLGIFSIFHPEAIKKVSFYKGAFPAQYGGRLSSVVDARTNDGDLHKWKGSVGLGIGLMTGKLHLEGPLKEGKTAISISARGNYLYFYDMYDFNLKLTHILDDCNRLFLLTYLGRDNIHWKTSDSSGQHFKSQDTGLFRWGNKIGSIRWNHVFNPKLYSNFTASVNHYGLNEQNESKEQFMSDKLQENQGLHQYNSGITDVSLRAEFNYTSSPQQVLRWGMEETYHQYLPEKERFEENYQEILNEQTSKQNGTETNFFLLDEFSPNEKITLNGGMHLSLFHTQGKSYLTLQPRLSASWNPNGKWSIKASYSKMAQYVHLLSTNTFSTPMDLWVPVTDKIKPMNSHQFSLGGYYKGWKDWEFSVEAYYKTLNNVLEYKDGQSILSSYQLWSDKVEMGSGRNWGVELMLEKTVGKTTGWLTYAWSKADRKFQSINNGQRFPFKYDRRHSINLSVNHQFNEKYALSGTWIYYTGGCLSLPESTSAILKPNDWLHSYETLEQSYHFTGRNNYRLPSTHRLNISLSMTKKLKRNCTRTWTLGLYNAYNAMNPNLAYIKRKPDYTGIGFNGVQYSNRPDYNVVKIITFLPILPSATYTYKF